MLISALLTSAGINIAICVVLLSLYSILRKQPGNASVYFGQRLSQLRSRCADHFTFERFVPSPGWLVKAWKASEEEILACGGVDAVAFLRVLILSIRIFSIAAVVCIILVLPLNYFGKEMPHHHIPKEDLDVFTIGNVKKGSKWLWAHCVALYVITCSACALLYVEYEKITNMRLAYIFGSSTKPSLFTVLVRGIPWSAKESYSDSVRNFFTKNYASSYLSHQMIYKCGTIQKLMDDAAKIYEVIAMNSIEHRFRSHFLKCGICSGATRSFSVLSGESESVSEGSDIADPDLREKECPAALVFFKTRYAAMIAAHALQSSNPMLWVTDLAPEPHDVYWKNLSIPYRQMWIRKLATLLASIAFMILFILPVTLVQGLLHLDGLKRKTSVLRGFLKNKFINDLATGYLPSVILMLFLLLVPPTMMLLSTIEGHFSRSGRKKSACSKILYFLIWNVFFVNVLSGKLVERVSVVSSPKDVTAQLATLVPTLGTFFVTYVLTSGWASLSVELMQPFPLLCNFFYKFVLRVKDEPSCGTLSFPYHTEIPRVLLFGVLGMIYSITAPLILPFLLVYFFLAYLVYCNQILNVYVTPYQSGGKFWPLIHTTFIFSLVLTQIIAGGVFGLKRSTIASAFTFPLIICTLLFSEYCRQRFHPIFKENVAEILIEMDRKDEESGKMEEMHKQLHSAYCQFASTSAEQGKTTVTVNHCSAEDSNRSRDPEDIKLGTSATSECEEVPQSSLEIDELDKKLDLVLQDHMQRQSHG